VRRPAVAGTWYPGTAQELASTIDGHLAVVDDDVKGDLVALIAPHAGLMYSGPVAAHAYRLLSERAFDTAVRVGPSHFVAFDGVAIVPSGGFDTPFGVAWIDADCASALMAASPAIHDRPSAHTREHSLEMQLPFLQRLAPGAGIVPLLMGHQTPKTARLLGDALAAALRGRRALLVASTDLSHSHDASTAAALDGVVVDCVSHFDADRLQHALRLSEHACGGGPTVAVMAPRRCWCARRDCSRSRDSGDVSGDKSSVVGYMAAALGNFGPSPQRRRTRRLVAFSKRVGPLCPRCPLW
jgi:AmmeMemoRadiSam system protein B